MSNDNGGVSAMSAELGLEPEACLKQQAFLILSRLQSGTENVVRLDVALEAVAAARKQGWDDCMILWADHLKRMNDAIAKPLPDGWANHAHHLAQNVREALKAAPSEAKAPNSN